MSPDVLTTTPEAPAPAPAEAPRDEVSAAANALADQIDEKLPEANVDTLNPLPKIELVAAVDPAAEFQPSDEPVAETPGAKSESETLTEEPVSVEKSGQPNGYVVTNSLTGENYNVKIEGPVTVESMKAALVEIGQVEFASRVGSIGPDMEPAEAAPAETTAEAATETADAALDDPDGLLDEAGQRQATEQIARYKTLMQSIVQNKDIPDHLKAQLISEAAKNGIDLDPTKPIDGKRKFTNKQKWGIGIVGTLLFMMMAVGAGAATTKA